MKVCAIVPAAGLGLRLKSNIAKPLALINGKPIVMHTLQKLSTHSLINSIVVLSNPRDISEFKKLIDKNKISKIRNIVEGGSTRKQSVKNGLSCLDDEDLVLIHDGVRPFIDHKIITNVIEAAAKNGAAVVGVPLKSTVKKINLNDLEIEHTLKREEVWEIQTPQVFKKELILKAYHNIDDVEAPDDAFLVERLGHRVVLVLGSYFNIKITTPEDIILAQAIESYISSNTQSN